MSPPPQTFLQRNAGILGVIVTLMFGLAINGTAVIWFAATTAQRQSEQEARLAKVEAADAQLTQHGVAIAVLEARYPEIDRRLTSIETMLLDVIRTRLGGLRP